jgi:hypothetical protein
VIFHVEGDRRARVGRGGADRTRIRLGHVLVEGLAQGRQLDADLGRRREPLLLERLQQGQVLVAGGVRLIGVEGVLAEMVQSDREPLLGQFPGDAQGVLRRLAGDEPAYDVPAERGGADELFDLGGSRRCEDHRTEHG